MYIKRVTGINWTDYSYRTSKEAGKEAITFLNEGYRVERISKCVIAVQNYQYYGDVDLTQPPYNYTGDL